MVNNILKNPSSIYSTYRMTIMYVYIYIYIPAILLLGNSLCIVCIVVQNIFENVQHFILECCTSTHNGTEHRNMFEHISGPEKHVYRTVISYTLCDGCLALVGQKMVNIRDPNKTTVHKKGPLFSKPFLGPI